MALADFFIPRCCCVCGTRLALREKFICIRCQSDLPRTYFSWMPRNQMADRFNELIRRDCAAEPYSFATALFYYRAGTGYRNITRNLKYGGAVEEGRYFSRILGSQIASSLLFRDVDAVVPVPLHWTRQLRRGYNQAEVIAAAISERIGARLYKNILRRRVRTKSQTRLNVEEKSRNVAAAFVVSKRYERELSAGRTESPHHILIVDDVFTTGATVHACHAALRKVFPPSVRISVATLAEVGW